MKPSITITILFAAFVLAPTIHAQPTQEAERDALAVEWSAKAPTDLSGYLAYIDQLLATPILSGQELNVLALTGVGNAMGDAMPDLVESISDKLTEQAALGGQWSLLATSMNDRIKFFAINDVSVLESTYFGDANPDVTHDIYVKSQSLQIPALWDDYCASVRGKGATSNGNIHPICVSVGKARVI